MPRKLHPPVRFLKLGRRRCKGLYYPTKQPNGLGKIEIDERLTGRLRLDTLIHEFMHHRMPEWAEEKVTTEARRMAAFLWKQKYRHTPEPCPEPPA